MKLDIKQMLIKGPWRRNQKKKKLGFSQILDLDQPENCW